MAGSSFDVLSAAWSVPDRLARSRSKQFGQSQLALPAYLRCGRLEVVADAVVVVEVALVVVVAELARACRPIFEALADLPFNSLVVSLFNVGTDSTEFGVAWFG